MRTFYLFSLLLVPLFAHSQSTSDVNEPCSPSKLCSSGLYCVKVDRPEFEWDYVCCECDQSKLDSYTKKVNELCKNGILKGIPENEVFKEYIASDGRAAVIAFDELMEMVKECQEARLDREETCWDGGDRGHRDAIDQLKNQNSNLADDKKEWIDDKKVYYCTKSTYESSLSNFKYKCPLNRTETIEDKIEDMQDDFDDHKPIDCDELEKFAAECEKCQDAAADFLDDCFNDKIETMPEDYFEMFDKSGTVWKQAKELLSKAKSSSLCD